MITLFDLLQLLAVVGGFAVGLGAGREYGLPGAIAGGLCGGIVGWKLGEIPTRLRGVLVRKKLAPFSVAELERHLRDFNFQFMTPNYLLLELKLRGEDIQKHLPLVLDMLGSDSIMRRQFGFAALLSFFPETAGRLRGYNPSAAEDCQRKVAALKQEISESATRTER